MSASDEEPVVPPGEEPEVHAADEEPQAAEQAAPEADEPGEEQAATEADEAQEPATIAQGAAEAEESPAPARRRSRSAAPSDAEESDEETAAPTAAPRRRRAGKAAAATSEAQALEGETPAKPARTRRTVGAPSLPRLGRGRRTPARSGEAPVVTATAKYVRSSARKARLVCDHIRGKSVPEARAILAFAPRGVARDWSKLLESAVANAEHNHELIGEELWIKEIHADVGPTLKRFRPRAQGRATPINKRTSHLSIALTPKE